MGILIKSVFHPILSSLCVAGVLDVHRGHANEPGEPAVGTHPQHAAHVRGAGALPGRVQPARAQGVPGSQGQGADTAVLRGRVPPAQTQLIAIINSVLLSC
jgi:hypothetical protein